MKKYSVPIRLLTVKDNIHTDLRTSHTQFLGKAVSIERKTPKIKFCRKKEHITGKKVKIIEIIFQFCLPAGCECTGTPIVLLAEV